MGNLAASPLVLQRHVQSNHPDVLVVHFFSNGPCTHYRKVISSCCSVSWVIEAFRYMKFLWSRPWRGNTWRRRRGVVRKDRLISWWVGAMTYHMNGPSVKLSWRWALCQSCFFDNTRRQSWQTSQPACHLFPERCRFIRWLYWGQAQLSVRMLDVNVPQGRM